VTHNPELDGGPDDDGLDVPVPDPGLDETIAALEHPHRRADRWPWIIAGLALLLSVVVVVSIILFSNDRLERANQREDDATDAARSAAAEVLALRRDLDAARDELAAATAAQEATSACRSGITEAFDYAAGTTLALLLADEITESGGAVPALPSLPDALRSLLDALELRATTSECAPPTPEDP
jgi:hypothetical protein